MKKSKYIDFRKEAIKSKLTKNLFEEKIKFLTENYKLVYHTTIRSEMPAESYSLTYNDRMFYLTVFDGKHYYWYTCNHRDDNKNIEDNNVPFSEMTNRFKDRTNITFKKAFGDVNQNFKTNVPQPLYFISDNFAKLKWINHVTKEDFSSHYPSCAIQKLPDANTAITLKGYQRPNQEYEFAFYPDSGHIEIFGEFDTRNYMLPIELFTAQAERKTFKTNYDLPIDKESKTILMKASKYTLENEMKYFYNIKKKAVKDSDEYRKVKLFLLKFIGMMEQVNPRFYKSYPYAHLASVIKWRANIKTFKHLDTIGYENIIQVCVDGIIHKGKPIGVDKKELGNLVKEVVDAKFIQRGINQYIIKNDQVEERRTAGLDIDTDKDIDQWKASDKIKFLDYIQNKYNL